MPDRTDELAERRFAKLVDQVQAMMSVCLKPEYRGFYGQLVLNRDAVAELGELADVRKAARAAGRRPGWRVHTHAGDSGVLFIVDDRDSPAEVRDLAAHRAADAVSAVITRARNEARMIRTGEHNTLPELPHHQGEGF
ncbi:hypothetical protein [Nonomuraea antri]|uniref:hypothetical protein n=1 Tax=Nonomuraea antri TaxID=2730852 RepID=UPI001569FAE3|nr:hypothetical protein [Nonomuraea antri]